MTEHTVVIDFMEPEMPDTLVHRVRNLAEDIERALSCGRDARIAATNQLRITVVSQRPISLSPASARVPIVKYL